MHDNGNPGSTTYIVEFVREQGGNITVDVPGRPSPEARAEAMRIAQQRRETGEVIAWAAVGDPVIFAAEPVVADAVA